ncbi:MAG: hypothetical protein KBB11_03820 [Bacteroidales bacterium]|nr:hypothetical protein [Bacteroidales bacterium]
MIVIHLSTFAQTEVVGNNPEANHVFEQDSNSLEVPIADTLVIPALGEHAPAPDDPDFATKKRHGLKITPMNTKHSLIGATSVLNKI